MTPLPHASDEAPVQTSYTDVANLRRPARGADAGGFRTVADFHDAYKSGKVTPSEVVEGILPLIRRDVEGRSAHSTAWVDSKVELVRKAAEASTKRWREGGALGVLDGVPFGVKDDVNVKGYVDWWGNAARSLGYGEADFVFVIIGMRDTLGRRGTTMRARKWRLAGG